MTLPHQPYDFRDAAPSQGGGELIPAKTVVPVRIAVIAGDPGSPENSFQLTKTGIWQLELELTITEGPHARRKIWERLTMGAPAGTVMSDNQMKGVSISGSTLRTILEASRGFAPTDESPAAVASRTMKTLHELEGLECWIEVGIKKGNEGYSDSNRLGRVLPFGSSKSVTAPATAGGASGVAPRQAAPATPSKASWAQ